MRLKRARQLLDTRNFTIMEVAYQTGFNDPKYFSLCFKKYYGMRPSVYLKQSTEVLDRTDTTDTTDITDITDTTDDTDDTTAQR